VSSAAAAAVSGIGAAVAGGFAGYPQAGERRSAVQVGNDATADVVGRGRHRQPVGPGIEAHGLERGGDGGEALTEPLERYTRYCQTSSSTGRPLRWIDTNENWQWMLECWKAVYRGARPTISTHVLDLATGDAATGVGVAR